MIVRLLLWSLAGSKTTIEELRRVVRDEVVEELVNVPGLRFKGWFSDEVTERWGAVELWESREFAELPVYDRERELIGKNPEVGEELELEASIEGRFFVEELSRRGLAFGDEAY